MLQGDVALRLLEWGHKRTPLERALGLVVVADRNTSYEDVCDWAVGRRDQRLFAMHREFFGDALQAHMVCAACEAPLELSLSISAIEEKLSLPRESSPHFVEAGGYAIDFRCLTSRDLLDVLAMNDVTSVEGRLLERCVVGALDANGNDVGPSLLPREVIEELLGALSKTDPYVDIVLDLSCAQCAHQWSVVLDISQFLWVRMTALAYRAVGDVHTLARFYGWSETQVLNMSEFRRGLYLELATYG